VNTTPLHTTDDQPVAPVSRASLSFDPLLLLGAMGLVAFSIVTLKGATDHGSTGLYYVERQAIYGGVGLLLALLISRFDYSRLREYRYAFYVILVLANIVVFGMPAEQGATRWIPLPFLQLQPSEFGKLLLIVALAAFLVDRARQLYERRTTARIMLLALFPAMIVIAQPDLGTGLVYVTIAAATLFFELEAAHRPGGAVRGRRRARARRRSGGRRQRAQDLPEGTAHHLRQSAEGVQPE
jgi:rod shape determining protein RodA